MAITHRPFKYLVAYRTSSKDTFSVPTIVIFSEISTVPFPILQSAESANLEHVKIPDGRNRLDVSILPPVIPTAPEEYLQYFFSEYGDTRESWRRSIHVNTVLPIAMHSLYLARYQVERFIKAAQAHDTYSIVFQTRACAMFMDVAFGSGLIKNVELYMHQFFP